MLIAKEAVDVDYNKAESDLYVKIGNRFLALADDMLSKDNLNRNDIDYAVKLADEAIKNCDINIRMAELNARILL